MLRLLGVCAAAALLAVCWTAAGASAQSEPAVTIEYEGWAATDADEHSKVSLRNPTYQFSITGGGTWHCRDLNCHFVHIEWEGIPERPDRTLPERQYTVVISRDAPSAAAVGVSDENFNAAAAATEMSLYITELNNPGVVDHAHLGMPWVGEKVTVTVIGHEDAQASAVVRIPADIPETFRAREPRGGATLLTDAESTLPQVVSVWPKVAGATHYELQYTFRTRSSRASGKHLTRVTRIVSASQGADEYGSLGANWGQRPNAAELGALGNEDVGAGGGWIAVVTTLPELLAGAAPWVQETVGGEQRAAAADILAALRAGKRKNALGIRVRPMITCIPPPSNSTGCSPGSNPGRAAPLALRGKTSRISYVQFEGANMAEWVSSAGTAR